MTITERQMPRGRNLCTFSGCLMGKTREKKTQMASLLALATVFTWSFYSQRGGGLYMRQNYMHLIVT